MPPNPKTELGPPQAARGPPGVSLCHPRAAQQPPRRPRRRPLHALPMVCATSSVTTPVTLDAAVGRAMCIVRGTKEFSMPAEVLAKMARSRWVVVELLITWLEVEARHGPRSCRHHPRQRKLWRARSCSSTSLLLRRSSTSGGPPSGASSPSPTKTIRDRRGPRVGAPPSHHMLALGGPGELRPRCTLLLLASRRGRRPVVTTLVITSP